MTIARSEELSLAYLLIDEQAKDIERLQAEANEVNAARIFLRDQDRLLKEQHKLRQQIALLREALETYREYTPEGTGVAEQALAATETKP